MRRTGKDAASPATGIEACGGAGITKAGAFMKGLWRVTEEIGDVFTRLPAPRLVPQQKVVLWEAGSRRSAGRISRGGTLPMWKWIRIALAVVVVVLLGRAIWFFMVTPGRIERGQNKVVAIASEVPPAAQDLHATLDVADMHADSLLWKRDLLG